MMKTERIVAGSVVRAAVKRSKRKARRSMIRRAFGSLLLLTAGFWLGVHRNVIRALVKGEPLPELPEGHPDCAAVFSALRKGSK